MTDHQINTKQCYLASAFNPGHVEHTSLLHRSDVFFGVMDQQPSPCKSFCYVPETKNSESKRRWLIPAHRLCDKGPNNLKAVLITIIKRPDLCSCLSLYLQTLSCCEPLIFPFGSLHGTFFISFVAIVYFCLLCTKTESKFLKLLNIKQNFLTLSWSTHNIHRRFLLNRCHSLTSFVSTF